MATNYFVVSPDVPFGLGDRATFNQDPSSWRNGKKPMVVVDLVLYTLPIPDFTTISPVYFATPHLAEALKSFTGLRRRSYSLDFDTQMEELGEFEGKSLPELVCFDVVGLLGKDDFAFADGVPGVIVSEQALKTLETFDLGPAEIEPYVR